MHKKLTIFDIFMRCQVKKINIDKWNKGIEISADPGESFILTWIDNEAKNFKMLWENSKCKSCSNSLSCGHNVVNQCKKYEEKTND